MGSIRVPLLLGLCTVLLHLSPLFAQSGYPLEVIDLADADFEAKTQAATGQTTGSW